MSLKVVMLAIVLALVGTTAAIKLVPNHKKAPYASAFRVTYSDALACPDRVCRTGPVHCENVIGGGGCNIKPTNPPQCAPVWLCIPDQE